ncbi:MAG TPA: heme-binding beta-barrel domain-containing protein [Rhizomicrobium sp.]|nr:heme-binding beta-barrel domain-containing protein [Rhizomicrobium sp.]
MNPFPDDIFTEPEDVDPDTLANLGPLRRLAGVWESSKGIDIAPKAPGPDRRKFIERIEMQPTDPQANGPQLLYGLRYHVHINTDEEDITFHDQVGYWSYEPATGLIMQSLTIPRGQAVLSVGHAKPDDTKIVVEAKRGQTNYGIVSTDFLEYAFRTDAFRLEITFNPDGSWSYVSDTMLKVRGQDELFRHRDVNTLVKVAEPTPNPLLLRVRAKAATGG